MPTQTLSLHSPDDACHLAQQLAPRLNAGDVLLLTGGVGAGKTHFARCLIQASLDTPEDVPSPTFTLVQTYPGRQGDIWHADLYRLTDIAELDELGLQEAFTDAICLIEWPDRLGQNRPVTALDLTLDVGQQEEERQLTLSWNDPRWGAKLTGLIDD